MTNSNDMPLAARPIDRAAHRRCDGGWLDAAFQRDDVLIVMMRNGDPFVSAEGGLVWMGPEVEKISPGSPRLFLGEDTSGAPVFAINLPSKFDVENSLVAGVGDFVEFRAAAARMSDLDANCASTARSLFMWHTSHAFCAKCGAQTALVEAGWKRECPACGTEHFPRTDPVAIMLAVKGDKCLVGRQANWPAGFVSCLAGFCEPGETIEQAAAREILEEAGIRCDPARAEYIACQPWPFPSSLMVGLILEAETEDVTVDEKELESAEWISREDLKKMLAGAHERFYCPPKTAIAHHLLKEWAERTD
ncbi:MAG: NAD(+) diphosphatase [Alphaproteobacteria bacterium]|nr:NAD(+) diphosphatase [Hyphomonas sp.]MBR9806921.1 NAD(+) diphosphatase [Alphaproteobacteria bacterium]|tara:strand:- start:2007 stop:2924 length:918 start_codon:yes stop_codon:yes gene_type:complete